MIVGRAQFDEVVGRLRASPRLTVDTETTGLRPYHGDRLFSVILKAPDQEPCYFNFQAQQGVGTEHVLTPAHLREVISLLADPTKQYAFFNASYDLHILSREGCEVSGEVYCAQVGARLLRNSHLKVYSLEECAAEVGVPKSSAVDDYIDEHGLSEKVAIPGKKTKVEKKFFDRVPLDIIGPYGCQDTAATEAVAGYQRAEFAKRPPAHAALVANEMRLIKTVHRMEARGVLIDRPYCERALVYENDRVSKALEEFHRITGRAFTASNKLFAEVFADERDKWAYTDKGNPSFEYDVIKYFQSPAAKAVLSYRDAKSRADFYQGFLYHADCDGVVHPHFLQDGTATGRFSSSEPNLQNMTSEEDEEDLQQEFVVRRAIIPRPGHVFIMPDYSQMEYRMMFDYVCTIAGYLVEVARQIKEEGKDPHQATADVVTGMGFDLQRKRAKNGNFAFLYGSGDKTLAKTIGATVDEAARLREMLLRATPEMGRFISQVKTTAKVRGWVTNWFGRYLFCDDPNHAYKMPNHLIQGGCADVNKIGLNLMDEYLLGRKSKLVLTIHDENPVEVHESELAEVPRRCKELMESVYPHKYLPMAVDMEWSYKSLADKKKGFPA